MAASIWWSLGPPYDSPCYIFQYFIDPLIHFQLCSGLTLISYLTIFKEVISCFQYESSFMLCFSINCLCYLVLLVTSFERDVLVISSPSPYLCTELEIFGFGYILKSSNTLELKMKIVGCYQGKDFGGYLVFVSYVMTRFCS